MDATQAMSAQHTIGHRGDTPFGGVAVVTIGRVRPLFAAESGRWSTGRAHVGDPGDVAGAYCDIPDAMCDAAGRDGVYCQERRSRRKGRHEEWKSPDKGDQW